ncbi:Aste57867_19284 [Aphanomyces stellatus]|uniref:Aste57867_19284 protein n=1 Tax=Aphanomyces stellatus TaxID=120398 RepID=A0A485LD06_9STRA|nr:hypothetical protein As57867_019220 [Aphanomyces stellatus]VFT96004.1 Aste57867_19284 [Aphanomyces stellatus]
MVDEVYQVNVYMGPAYDNVKLASFHSTSKGFTGECGLRGRYMELVNFDRDVMEELYKLVSINLCSNIEGQLMAAFMRIPPKPGDASHAL